MLGPSIWNNAVLGLTHASESAAPPGVPFEEHVEQRAQALRAAITKVRCCGGVIARLGGAVQLQWHYCAALRAPFLRLPGPASASAAALRRAVPRQPAFPLCQHRPSCPAPPPPTCTSQASGVCSDDIEVALIENSSRCPTNDEGEKVVPGSAGGWLVDLVDKLAEVAMNVQPWRYDPRAAARAANPNRRRKWLIPLVLAAQVRCGGGGGPQGTCCFGAHLCGAGDGGGGPPEDGCRVSCAVALLDECVLALSSASLCCCPAALCCPPPKQVALKLLLDRVVEEDGVLGDANGPFDAQTVKERREDLARDKVRWGALCGGERTAGWLHQPSEGGRAHTVSGLRSVYFCSLGLGLTVQFAFVHGAGGAAEEGGAAAQGRRRGSRLRLVVVTVPRLRHGAAGG